MKVKEQSEAMWLQLNIKTLLMTTCIVTSLRFEDFEVVEMFWISGLMINNKGARSKKIHHKLAPSNKGFGKDIQKRHRYIYTNLDHIYAVNGFPYDIVWKINSNYSKSEPKRRTKGLCFEMGFKNLKQHKILRTDKVLFLHIFYKDK